MDKNVKRRWVRALESGKYIQGTNCLANSDGEFCCLGVLCDLYAKTKKIAWKEADNCGEKALEGFRESKVLPRKVAQWAGLGRKVDPEVEISGEKTKLAQLNDTGSSFKKIAKLIKSSKTL